MRVFWKCGGGERVQVADSTARRATAGEDAGLQSCQAPAAVSRAVQSWLQIVGVLQNKQLALERGVDVYETGGRHDVNGGGSSNASAAH